MRLRVALVGHGRDWKSTYQPLLLQLRDRFEVCGVYHSVSALADATAQTFDTVRVDSLVSLVRRADLDAILMLDADWYGLRPISLACEHGKAIFVGSEVPLDPTALDTIRGAVQRSGIAFCHELPRRSAPATIRLKELIATQLGRPKLLFCHRRVPVQTSAAGALSDNAADDLRTRCDRELVELLDWCRFLVGADPAWVQAIEHRCSERAVADYQIVSLGFELGSGQTALAQISCGAYIPAHWHEAVNFRPPAAIQVCCENGLAFVDLPSSLVWFDSAGRHQEHLEGEYSACHRTLMQFHCGVTSLVQRNENLTDTVKAFHVYELARQSMSAAGRMHIPPM